VYGGSITVLALRIVERDYWHEIRFECNVWKTVSMIIASKTIPVATAYYSFVTSFITNLLYRKVDLKRHIAG